MQKTKILYMVNQRSFAADRTDSFFFETEKEANEYYLNNKLTDKPQKVKLSMVNARTALQTTKWELAFLKYFNG